MARQAAVSSESQRVIYSWRGGERAGDPENANRAGRAGALGAQGVVGECQHCGMREGKGGDPWEQWVAGRWGGPHKEESWSHITYIEGFRGGSTDFAEVLGAPLPQSWVKKRLQGGSDVPFVPRHPPGAWSQYPGMELLPEHPPHLPLPTQLGLGSRGNRVSTETPALAMSWIRGCRIHACSWSRGDGEWLQGASMDGPGPPQLQHVVCCCRWLSGQLQRSRRPQVPGFYASPRSAEGVAHAQQSSCPSSCQLLVHLPISVHVPSVLGAPPSILIAPPSILPAPPSLLNAHPFIFKAPPSILAVHAVLLSTPQSCSLLHTQPSSLHVPGPTHMMV